MQILGQGLLQRAIAFGLIQSVASVVKITAKSVAGITKRGITHITQHTQKSSPP